jgi:hypothetical protein
MDHGLAADNYYVTAVPDISRTTGSLYYGEYTDAVAAAGEADDVMIVQRIFIPHVVTVTHVDLLNIDIANGTAGDNTQSTTMLMRGRKSSKRSGLPMMVPVMLQGSILSTSQTQCFTPDGIALDFVLRMLQTTTLRFTL